MVLKLECGVPGKDTFCLFIRLDARILLGLFLLDLGNVTFMFETQTNLIDVFALGKKKDRRRFMFVFPRIYSCREDW